MKTLVLLLMSTLLMAQEATIVKSFPIESWEYHVNLPGEIEVVRWDSEIIRIEVTCEVNEGLSHLLERLIQVGRYRMEIRNGEIVMPNLSKEIWIKGEKLSETLQIKISAPEGISVYVVNEISL